MNDGKTLRLFIAVQPDAPFVDALAGYQSALRTRYEGVRWLPRENLHLTVKFLGSVPQDKVESVNAAVSRAAEGTPATELRFTRLQAFPSWRRPSVVVVAADPEPALGKLAAALESALEPLGFPRETRPFRPHMTLGRAKGEVRLAGEERPAEPELRLRCTRLTLFQSTVAKGGSAYKALQSWPLGS